MRLFSPFLPLQAFLRHFSSTTHFPKLTQIPIKHRTQAIKQAQQVLTDYLHTTSALPFAYAESISNNSICNLSEQIISKVQFSPNDFTKTLLKFLRYNPINEFGFLYESIGIDYAQIDGLLKPNVHFFCDDCNVLDVVCTLAGLGFPWNKIGKLYVEEVSIFERKIEVLGAKLNGLLEIGFSNEQAVGICLGFPCLLKGDEDGLSSEFHELVDELKRVFVDFDLGRYVEGNVDVWYEVCRKLKVFYDLGVKKGKVGESIDRSYSILIDFSEELLGETVEFLSKLGVEKADVGLLLLSNPEIMNIDLDSVLSVEGFLNHFGLLKKEVDTLMKIYPYVFGHNKMCNLPNILRALDLHQWFFHKVKWGKANLLANYNLSNPDEGKDKDYVQNLEKCKCVRTYGYSLSKLEFLHGIGFGENVYTIKLLVVVHGSASDLQERFEFLLNEGIEYSKLCKMIVHTPKFLNQELDSLKQKIDFLRKEVGLSLDYVENFPAFLIYNLENRIKPRYRFHVWLTKQGWCTKTYSLLGIVAISHKSFMAKIASIHPKAPQLWLEQFGQKKEKISKS